MPPHTVDPEELRANAWCGEPARGALTPGSLAWGIRDLQPGRQMLAAPEIDLANWKDPAVGWGVVLPERANIPEPIRALLAARAPAPVLRYDANLEPGTLRRYDEAGNPLEPSFRGKRGTGPTAMPYYLLIVGSPAEIPWTVQYRLQTEAFVGRLDLDEVGLGRYVEALLGGWGAAKADPRRPVIWAVDHGLPDITRLMRKTIAEPVHAKFALDSDADMTEGLVTDGRATHEGLREALESRRPAFVLTTSHGATHPLDDVAAMRRQLGLPVDDARSTLDMTLLPVSNLHGAIWYAHACCSAGADARSTFEGVVGADSSLGRTFAGIARVGACTAPLPRALLGSATPLRAFVGHVEPTFDWTLRSPTTGQVTTHHIVASLYDQLHRASRPPLGLALNTYFRAVAGLLRDHVDARDDVDAHVPGAAERARRARLMAEDQLAMVLLGDPTVIVPPAS